MIHNDKANGVSISFEGVYCVTKLAVLFLVLVHAHLQHPDLAVPLFD